MYLDVEPLLTAWLPTVLTCRAVTELPSNLAAQVPLVKVERVGGPDNVPSLDEATVDIECFAATRPAARALADEVRNALRFLLPGPVTGGAVSRVQTVNGPAWRPYDNPNVRRVGALYQITTHTA